MKNVTSMVLATTASIAWGFASRRFDSPGKQWAPAAVIGIVLLSAQLGLLFVESKEEEELSSLRKQRDAELERVRAEQQRLDDERKKISNRIQTEIDSGNMKLAEEWTEFRRRHHGK